MPNVTVAAEMMPFNIQVNFMPWQQILENMDVYSMCVEDNT